MRLKASASTMFLSHLWWLIEPLLHVAVFYVVFAVFLKAGGENYFSFLIVGKFIYLWFSKSVTAGAVSIVQNKGILAQRAVPKIIFPLVYILESFYKFLPAFFIMLTAILILHGIHFHTVFHLLLLMIATFIFITGVTLLCSIFVSIALDFSNLISIVMMAVMFVSGVFWDINAIQDDKIRELVFLLNPLGRLIDCYRLVLIDGVSYDIIVLLPAFIIGGGLIVFSVYVFKKFNNVLARCIFV